MRNKPSGPEELKSALEAELGEPIACMDMAELLCPFDPFKGGDWGFLMVTQSRVIFRAFEKIGTLEQFVRPRDGDPLAWSAILEIGLADIESSTPKGRKGFLDKLFKAPEPIELRLSASASCSIKINGKGGVEGRRQDVGAEGATLRAMPLAKGKEVLEALLALK